MKLRSSGLKTFALNWVIVHRPAYANSMGGLDVLTFVPRFKGFIRV